MSRDIGNILSHLGDDELHPFFAVELMFYTPSELIDLSDSDLEIPDGYGYVVEDTGVYIPPDEIEYRGQTIELGPVYLWSGYGDLEYDGKTYIGAGNLLHISDVTETADIRAAGASISLSGVSSTLLALAITQPYQGRLCNVLFGLMDSDGSVIDLATLFVGYMDQMNIEDGADTCTIQMTVESKLIDLERPRTFRYTSENLKARYENDLAFDFIPDLQDAPLIWGRES
jgi:hypothetical protein